MATSRNNAPDGQSRPLSHLHLSLYLLAIAFFLSLVIGIGIFSFITLEIPDVDKLTDYSPPATTVILDRHGKEIDRIFIENRFVIPYDRMPELLPLAFIAAEDARFFQHAGVDGWSILRALLHNVTTGERGQGGSTITQQVARSLLLTPEKTYTRKIKEAILAYRIDNTLSKKEILHIYLNQIYFGEGAHGVDAAARVYFDKRADQLSLAEISILAGLPQAPSRYSPFKHFELAKKRQAYVLNRMAEEGYITASMARAAYAQPLLWGAPVERDDESRYFVQHVKNDIQNRYGARLLTEGGLTVETTLDPLLQQHATAAVNRGVAKWALRQTGKSTKLPQAALLALENSTGQVRAVVGGTNFDKSQFNRATQAKRQPGSAFKPIVYAAALQSSFTPASIVIDEPLSLPGADGAGSWQPQNFTEEFYGPTTISTALIHSRNIVTIKLLQQLGTDPVRRLARAMGILSPMTKNLSLALGASEVTLLELTGAYTTFANEGKRVLPVFITRIIDKNGRILEQWQPQSDQALDRETAFQITHILKSAIEEGTGKHARGLAVEAAGKTGTTDRYYDAWFIGYTPEMACGVWLGYDQRTSLGRDETGGKACAPIWRDFMERVPFTQKSFPVPDTIVFLPIDKQTGAFNPGNYDRKSWMPFKPHMLPWPQPQQPVEQSGDEIGTGPAEGWPPAKEELIAPQ